MNANTSHILKRTMLSLVFGICLTSVTAGDALAHDLGYRRGFITVHYAYGDTVPFPGWLRRDRDFQHWYWHSRYRYTRHLNWHGLYHLYLMDRRHRWHGRSRHDHHHDYRGYERKATRRGH